MEGEKPSTQFQSTDTRFSNVTGAKFATNPLLPRLGQLGSPMLPIYPSLNQPETQATQFKSRFLPKHQKERSPLSPDRSVSSVRYNRNPFIAKASLSSLRENEESSAPHIKPKQNGGDRLTEQIQSFISRTDRVSNEWKKVGQQRAISVGPGGERPIQREALDLESLRLPLPAPARNAMRASSVAPNMGMSRIGNGTYDDYDPATVRLNPNEGLQRRNTYHNANGGQQPQRREFSPPRRKFSSPVRSPARDLDYSFRNTPSVNPSVASRAKHGPGFFANGGVSVASSRPRPSAGKFMSLEDECNWILSGREPLPDDRNGYYDRDDDSDGDDNTLDDISGDEVTIAQKFCSFVVLMK